MANISKETEHKLILEEIVNHFDIIVAKNIIKVRPKKENNNEWNQYIEIRKQEDILLLRNQIKNLSFENKKIEDYIIDPKKELYSKFISMCIKNNIDPNNHLEQEDFRIKIFYFKKSNKFFNIDTLQEIKPELYKKYKIEKFLNLKYFELNVEHLESFEEQSERDYFNEWYIETDLIYNSYKNQILKEDGTIEINKIISIPSKHIVNMVVYLLLKMMSGNDKEQMRYILNSMMLSKTTLKPVSMFLYIWGSGGEGKSVFENLWRKLIGELNYFLMKKDFLSTDNQFVDTQLINKTAVFGVEWESKKEDEPKLKIISDPNTKIHTDAKHSNEFVDVYCDALPIFINNYLPRPEFFNDDSLNRRMKFIKVASIPEMQKDGYWNEFSSYLFSMIGELEQEIIDLFNYLIEVSFFKKLWDTKDVRKIFDKTQKMIDDEEMVVNYYEYLEHVFEMGWKKKINFRTFLEVDKNHDLKTIFENENNKYSVRVGNRMNDKLIYIRQLKESSKPKW